MSSCVRNLEWVLFMSNVIMAIVSVVNGVPTDHPGFEGCRGIAARPARPSAVSSAHWAGRDRAQGAVSGACSFGPVAARALRPAVAAGLIGAAVLLRRRYLRWGATEEDQNRALPGDELLPTVHQSATRAITIGVTADDIWPWIAQLGQGRGGFYSYDGLENVIAHADIHNAASVVPEWQHIAVGAEIRLAPEVPLRVAALEPGRSLVLRGSVPPMGKIDPPYDFTWAFVLLPQPDGTTRLVARERYEYTRRWAALIVQPAQLVSSFMSPKMLRGIKIRAEHAQAPTALNGSARKPPLQAGRHLPTATLPT